MFLQQSAAEQRRLLETVIEKATWKDGQLQTALGGEGMIAYASNISSASTVSSPRARVAAYGWQALAGELDNYGCAVLPKLLSPEECRAIAALYSDESHFRSQVQMARHGFGKGEYRYCKYPLPGLLGYLRTALYPQLASVANEWNSRIGIEERYPVDHGSFLKRCHAAAQTRLNTATAVCSG